MKMDAPYCVPNYSRRTTKRVEVMDKKHAPIIDSGPHQGRQDVGEGVT